MTNLQATVVVLWGFLGLAISLAGFYQCRSRRKAYGATPLLLPFGSFVWGDAAIFGLFWLAAALVCFLLGDWLLFLLITSLFWVVRSLGEMIYWFNQQFSKVNRNPPEDKLIFRIFHNDAVWFVYQIVWQCVLVAALVASIYLTHLWLSR